MQDAFKATFVEFQSEMEEDSDSYKTFKAWGTLLDAPTPDGHTDAKKGYKNADHPALMDMRRQLGIASVLIFVVAKDHSVRLVTEPQGTLPTPAGSVLCLVQRDGEHARSAHFNVVRFQTGRNTFALSLPFDELCVRLGCTAELLFTNANEWNSLLSHLQAPRAGGKAAWGGGGEAHAGTGLPAATAEADAGRNDAACGQGVWTAAAAEAHTHTQVTDPNTGEQESRTMSPPPRTDEEFARKLQAELNKQDADSRKAHIQQDSRVASKLEAEPQRDRALQMSRDNAAAIALQKRWHDEVVAEEQKQCEADASYAKDLEEKKGRPKRGKKRKTTEGKPSDAGGAKGRSNPRKTRSQK
jgi:hypothetical protein